MKFTEHEIREMEKRIGHRIPRPSSQVEIEDLTVMPESAKLAEYVHEEDKTK